MKVVIIDDEAKARMLLHAIIEEECPEVEEIFEADNLLSGVSLIKSEQPQIVFLDIEMPEKSGLEILDYIDKIAYNFEIIFVTAYSDYAIQAFQLSAIDYILKPAHHSKVRGAFEKVVKNLQKENNNLFKLEQLKKTLAAFSLKKIGLPHSEGVKFVNYNDIIALEADGMYTKVSLIDSEVVMVSKPLRYFLDYFDKLAVFYRPHRSFLINLTHVKEFVKKDGGYIIMETGKLVSISRDKREEFLTISNSL